VSGLPVPVTGYNNSNTDSSKVIEEKCTDGSKLKSVTFLEKLAKLNTENKPISKVVPGKLVKNGRLFLTQIFYILNAKVLSQFFF